MRPSLISDNLPYSFASNIVFGCERCVCVSSCCKLASDLSNLALSKFALGAFRTIFGRQLKVVRIDAIKTFAFLTQLYSLINRTYELLIGEARTSQKGVLPIHFHLNNGDTFRNCVRPYPAITLFGNIFPETVKDILWRLCLFFSMFVYTGFRTVVPFPLQSKIGFGSKFAVAKSTDIHSCFRFILGVMLFDMAISAEKEKPVRILLNFLRIGSSTSAAKILFVGAVNVVKMQCSNALVITATLTRIPKLNNQFQSKFCRTHRFTSIYSYCAIITECALPVYR